MAFPAIKLKPTEVILIFRPTIRLVLEGGGNFYFNLNQPSLECYFQKGMPHNSESSQNVRAIVIH